MIANYYLYIFLQFITVLVITIIDEYLLGCVAVVFFSIFLKPKYLFSFSSIFLANFSLYLALPSALVFVVIKTDYNFVLKWIEAIAQDFYDINQSTFFLIWLSFNLIYLPTIVLERHYFTPAKGNLFITQRISNSVVSKIFKRIYLLVPICILLNAFILNGMGGISSFLSDYSGTFLRNRSGLGLPIVVTTAVTEVLIILLGLIYSTKRTFLNGIILLGVTIILFNGFLMGFKSRIVILTLLFFLPKILTIPFNIKIIIKCLLVFFPLLLTLSYVRTNGYYSGILFLEMFIAYFNVIPLHEKILGDFQQMSVFSIFWSLNKIFNTLGLSAADYDLSIYLTKIYYPSEWYRDSATQQWTLLTQIYLNFGLGVFILIPCIWFVLVMSFSMYLFHKKIINVFFLFLFTMEVLRVLVIFKGGIFHYDFFYQMIKYLVAFACLWGLRFERS